MKLYNAVGTLLAPLTDFTPYFFNTSNLYLSTGYFSTSLNSNSSSLAESTTSLNKIAE